jgi:hypothetical protein
MTLAAYHLDRARTPLAAYNADAAIPRLRSATLV